MKSLIVIATLLLFSAMSFAQQTQTPLNSIWKAASRNTNGVWAYDLRDVNFEKDGAYDVRLILDNGAKITAKLEVKTKSQDNCYTISGVGLEDVDTSFCPVRTESGIKTFSNRAFQQLIGATTLENATELSNVEFKPVHSELFKKLIFL